MKYYDYKKAKSIIECQSELVSASLGMHEDWFWTAETIWENGKYINAHFDNLEQNDRFELAGTSGSTWATHLHFSSFLNQEQKLCYNVL